VKAMVLEQVGGPLVARQMPEAVPSPGQVLLDVSACGVCRTDLHLLDGELPHPKLPLVLGHQVVGRVRAKGDAVQHLAVGQRVGIPWLGWTDGTCSYCLSGRENLCPRARFTGYQLDGGYAERTVADARYCFPLPDSVDDVHAAPLLCAGLIGFRALRLAGTGETLGLYGFGASAHLVAQVAKHQGRRVFAFTRDGDTEDQDFARAQGVVWAGGSSERPPEALDAAIIFAPVGSLVVRALEAVGPGGKVVCAGIHMSDIPSFPYRLLWEERMVRSVANLTREDGVQFLQLVPRVPVRPEVTVFPLAQANEALEALRQGRFRGAAVLSVGG
jgi:alcohol dehydrogenase, propanol-preferring